ncbi:immunity 49 family protein [Streptomyces sp. P9(2023)]|uniref:immunity 49 family protein n=1 Tax=Streptomyces sp. P9(2023) TaxID=3064394 RepID=UPI0028F45B8F|nr:immunity 49 family protein [Streptomyces sp. P9(2023)]MDT9687374.1 immunity 49 family protein [Streptomyces sp. P9(2023)]
MREVAVHELSEERIAAALDDIHGRAFGRWHSMRYDSFRLDRLREMADELLDHVAARALTEPGLDDISRRALLTAAECSLGVISLGCYPNGDQELRFPLVREELTSEELAFKDVVDEAPTARTWLDTFAAVVVSGLVWDWQRVTGLLLRGDFARDIRDGVPYSKLTSTSEPADLAAMEALCLYLTEESGHLPRDWPTVPLRKPDPQELADAAERLDAAGVLTPDQRLLRVLLDDDRRAFEEALADRLVAHRESVGTDPAPRTLLPLDTLALAALAVQVHGWELDLRTAYLPHGIVGSSDALRRAADAGENNLGVWHAK